MTYKHISQNESEVMQQFTKLAKEKNLIAEETQLERAARSLRNKPKSLDLSPSNNLNADLLRLCTGLREKGLVAEAGRLEARFRTLTAQNYVRMYGTDGETGEALLEWAHPEGSVEMAEAQDKHGVVEDKIQQHKMIREIVEKEPTGKLASKDMVVAALRVILADENDFKINTDINKKNQSQAANMKDRVDALIANILRVAPNAEEGLGGIFNDLHLKKLNWYEMGNLIRPRSIKDMMDAIQSELDSMFIEFQKNPTNSVMAAIQSNLDVFGKAIGRIPVNKLDPKIRDQFVADVSVLTKEAQAIVDTLLGKTPVPAPEAVPAQQSGIVKEQVNSLTDFATWLDDHLIKKEQEIRTKNDPALTAWFEKTKAFWEKIKSGQVTTMNGDPEENKKKILAILQNRGL